MKIASRQAFAFGAVFAAGLSCGWALLKAHRISPPPAPTAPPLILPAETRLTRDFAVPVLMYHRICTLTPQEERSPLMRDLTVSPQNFAAQVAYLAAHQFTFLRAQDVAEAVRSHQPLPERSVVLTMDDGYRDNFEQAFPILRRYGATATFFLVTRTLDTPGHLTWEEIDAMPQIGYGSHTVDHADLTRLSPDRLDFELCASKSLLETRLHRAVLDLAYPSGHYSRLVAARTEAAGYRAGWKKGGGPVQPDQDLFLLPRIRVRGDTTMTEFQRSVWSGTCVMAERRTSRRKLRRSASCIFAEPQV